MTGGENDPPPPVNGGEFLLQLLKNPPHNHHHHDASQQQLIAPPPPPPPPPPATAQILTHDPAVAAVGPSIPGPFPQFFNGPAPPWSHPLHRSPPPFAPHNFFLQNPNPNSNFPSAPPPGFDQGMFQQHNIQLNQNPFGEDVRKLGLLGNNFSSSLAPSQDSKDLIFGSLRAADALIDNNFSDQSKFGASLLDERRGMGPRKIGGLNGNEVEIRQTSIDRDRNPRVNSSGLRAYGNVRSDTKNGKKGFENGGEKGRSDFGKLKHPSGKDEMESINFSKSGGNSGDYLDDRGLSIQLDRPGPPPGSTLHSVSASEIENSMMVFHGENGENEEEFGNERERIKGDGHTGHGNLDDLEEQLVDSLGLEDESDEKSDKKKPRGSRDKEYRSDKRGKWLLGQRMRYIKRQAACPGDIDRLNGPFLAIYESLIPLEEEKAKQKQLLTLLENVVCKEWPEARLDIYGSCANSFGFSKSDIDICLTINDVDINKAEVLLKLADMVQLENLQNVQALTRARVPIVKLMDPATGISCDICINNVLAVVNTKLLHDYAQIDVRLRQLAFIVKHWAKSRGVNETYQGTLSSYAYVLMCIHFLQQRRPAILPCLQGMKSTYSVTVDNVECSYFDQVENLIGFGSHNRETIAKLVWAFFRYWAYCHDYANDVISVRAGTVLSKRTKGWTRRIGNDRHLICIEDPFEISHDLGRVVDKNSIRVLREEFERAAEILQYDPNPCVKLFEPYVPI